MTGMLPVSIDGNFFDGRFDALIKRAEEISQNLQTQASFDSSFWISECRAEDIRKKATAIAVLARTAAVRIQVRDSIVQSNLLADLTANLAQSEYEHLRAESLWLVAIILYNRTNLSSSYIASLRIIPQLIGILETEQQFCNIHNAMAVLSYLALENAEDRIAILQADANKTVARLARVRQERNMNILLSICLLGKGEYPPFCKVKHIIQALFQRLSSSQLEQEQIINYALDRIYCHTQYSPGHEQCCQVIFSDPAASATLLRYVQGITDFTPQSHPAKVVRTSLKIILVGLKAKSEFGEALLTAGIASIFVQKLDAWSHKYRRVAYQILQQISKTNTSELLDDVKLMGLLIHNFRNQRKTNIIEILSAFFANLCKSESEGQTLDFYERSRVVKCYFKLLRRRSGPIVLNLLQNLWTIFAFCKQKDDQSCRTKRRFSRRSNMQTLMEISSNENEQIYQIACRMLLKIKFKDPQRRSKHKKRKREKRTSQTIE